jgi:dTDP-4-amino-4,6-dideoxygalactose transaminase
MPEIPHNRLTFGERECDAVLRSVRSGQWAQGPEVRELETTLARVGKVQHAVCVASGLAALRLTLGSLGIREGDKVLVPAYSCVALANAVLSWGATPVPVDVDAVNWNLEPKQCLQHAANSKPRAVISVNTFGVPSPVEEIISTEVPVIEDCAHAFGLQAGGQTLGSRTQAAIISFYATKLIGGGEGGAVLTNSPKIADFVRQARDYSDQSAGGHRMNDKMNDLEAALVRAQLDRLPEMIAAREAIAHRYLELLSGPMSDRVFRLPARTNPRIWYRFAVEMLTTSAETVITGLQRLGAHAASPVTDWRPAGSPSAGVADRAYRGLVSLPLYPTLTRLEQDAVAGAFLKLCEDYPRA